MLVGKAGLVGEEEERLDTRQAPPAALAGCHDGVAHAAIGQPARAAAVQAAIPGCIELARGGDLRTPLPAVRPCLLPCQLVCGGTQEQLSWRAEEAGSPGRWEPLPPWPPAETPGWLLQASGSAWVTQR